MRPHTSLAAKLALFGAAASALLACPDSYADTLLGTTGTTVSISLKNKDLPANDLIFVDHGNPRLLSPQEAQTLKTRDGVDLSKLDPDPTSDIWSKTPDSNGAAEDGALPVRENDQAEFLGVLQTGTGFFRMTVNPQGSDQGPVTLMLGKSIHTILLRKEILRRLGYKVPPVKYLAKLRVHFADAATLAEVLKVEIPNQTQGTPGRWCSMSAEALAKDKTLACQPSAAVTDPLTVEFQDLLALESTPRIYNLAVSAPIDPNNYELRPAGGRLLRAASVLFGLANLPESINQFAWFAATIDKQMVNFDVPESALFDGTLDDALWISRKLSALTRKDFGDIASGAKVPKAVALLLAEKLIARRNSLLKAFGVKVSDIAYDVNVTLSPDLKAGKLLKQDWPGYGTRFSWGDPESPLKNIQHYFYSLGESNLIDNLIVEFNNNLPGFLARNQIEKHLAELQNQAYQSFLQTGQNQVIRLGVWAAPIANASANISRSVIVGSYQGSDNILQLADNYGYSVNAGFILGVDGLPSSVSVGGVIKGNISLNFTRLKPLTDLKQATSEPLKNLYIPAMMAGAATVFSTLNDSKNQLPEQQKDINALLSGELDKLKDFLDVGESLIVTHGISGSAGVNGAAGIPGNPWSPVIGVGVTANQVTLSRIHIYRKDANTIQVFRDNGDVEGLALELTVGVGTPVAFPVFKLTANRLAGQGTASISTVNIDPTLKVNPDFFSNVIGLRQVLTEQSTEVLDGATKPAKVNVTFSDWTTDSRFLFWVNRTLNAVARVGIQLPDGSAGKYLLLSQGAQSGVTYQDPLADLATFLVQKLTSNAGIGNTNGVGISPNSSANPGQTLGGNSETRLSEFQARVDSGITDPMIEIDYRWQGWQLNKADAESLLRKVGEKFSYEPFAKDVLQDTNTLQLYKVSFALRLYGNAIGHIMAMTKAKETFLENRVEFDNHCSNPDQGFPVSAPACGALADFEEAMGQYRAGIKNSLTKAKVVMKVVSSLERLVSFPSFVELAGGMDNLYLRGKLEGFRVGSETLDQPILSNALGKPDPVAPEGVLSFAEDIIGVQDGEFRFQWLRPFL